MQQTGEFRSGETWTVRLAEQSDTEREVRALRITGSLSVMKGVGTLQKVEGGYMFRPHDGDEAFAGDWRDLLIHHLANVID